MAKESVINNTLERDSVMRLDERTGRTMIRKPAGGTGGGITSFAEVPATEAQHVEFLRNRAEARKLEGEQLAQQHEEADKKLQEHKAEQEKRAEKDGRPVEGDEPLEPRRVRDYSDTRPGENRPYVSQPAGPQSVGQGVNPPIPANPPEHPYPGPFHDQNPPVV